MARSRFRDGGGGQRRANARFTTSAWSLLLLTAVALAGCNLATPVAPNTDGQLTGQTTNQQFVFTGTISISAFGLTLTADDTSTVAITADVRDASGNPIPNLATIVFSTNLGAFVTEAGLTTVATATTFNGLAQVFFSSANRTAGTATITASLGEVFSSVNVTLEAEPVTGTISASFGASGTGATTVIGPPASEAVPHLQDISAAALDLTGLAIVGATVRFRIVTDTTDELINNGPVEFVGSSSSSTNSDGVASVVIRVKGPGDVIIEADLIDPITGQTVATSNQIILVTSAGPAGPSITLTFSDGSPVFSFGAPGGAATEGIIATVKDAAGKPLGGATVRFTMRSDSAGTARFSNGTGVGGSVTTTASTVGEATETVTLDTSPQTVVIRAELLDATGAVVAVSSDIIATYD